MGADMNDTERRCTACGTTRQTCFDKAGATDGDQCCAGCQHPRPQAEVDAESRAICLAAWPEAHVFGYDPRCCRFPKSCSIPDEPVTARPTGDPGEPWTPEQTAEWLRDPTGEPFGGDDGCRAPAGVPEPASTDRHHVRDESAALLDLPKCPAGDALEIDEAFMALSFMLGPGSPHRDGWVKLDGKDVPRLLSRLEDAIDGVVGMYAALAASPGVAGEGHDEGLRQRIKAELRRRFSGNDTEAALRCFDHALAAAPVAAPTEPVIDMGWMSLDLEPAAAAPTEEREARERRVTCPSCRGKGTVRYIDGSDCAHPLGEACGCPVGESCDCGAANCHAPSPVPSDPQEADRG